MVHGTSVDVSRLHDQLVVKNNSLIFMLLNFNFFNGIKLGSQGNRYSSITVKAINMLKAEFTNEEIKSAVWDYGGDRAFRPDDFSFRFLKHFWDILGLNVIAFVLEYYHKMVIPFGYNSSFVTFIPKVDSSILVKYYRPISLIDIQFKVIAKLLAKRLALVLPDIIGVEQTTFMKGR